MAIDKLQLIDDLVDTFRRANVAEMPTRVLLLPSASPPKRVKPDERWGEQPVVLLAVDRLAVLKPESGEPISMHQGDAAMMTGRDLVGLRAGGRGWVLGVESLGTQPCRFFRIDLENPEASREGFEFFCMPFANNLPECWKACHETHQLLESAQRQAKESSNQYEPTLRGVLRLALIECGRGLEVVQQGISKEVERSNSARVAEADRFVSFNIDRDIRKVELADRLGVSVSQLTLAFRDVGQLAVRDRIRFRRVESARNLLADTSLSVADVAERVGMNYRHFIRAFRQSTELTPLRYRKYARQPRKSRETLSAFIHTEKFDMVEPLESLSGGQPGQERGERGAVSVLISNLTDTPLTISRLEPGGTFVNVGIAPVQKRLSFLDAPGSLWKLEGAGGKPVFYRSGKTNSHFAVGLAAELA